jgi:hypothetical protein
MLESVTKFDKLVKDYFKSKTDHELISLIGYTIEDDYVRIHFYDQTSNSVVCGKPMIHRQYFKVKLSVIIPHTILNLSDCIGRSFIVIGKSDTDSLNVGCNWVGVYMDKTIGSVSKCVGIDDGNLQLANGWIYKLNWLTEV